jgi:hypothetical protein
LLETMRLENAAITVEIRCARSGKLLKKASRGRATIELVIHDDDECPVVTVQGKPPIAVRLEKGFQRHARFVHAGKLGFTSERGQRRSHIMVNCPGDLKGVASMAAVAERVGTGAAPLAAGSPAKRSEQLAQRRKRAQLTSTSPNVPARAGVRNFLSQRSGGEHQQQEVPRAFRPSSARSAAAAVSSQTTAARVDDLADLSAEQRSILTAVVKHRRNVYIGGGAGAGKSFLLSKIRARMPSATVLASTGAAACLIGGVTVHSFAGIGIGDGTIAQLTNLANRKWNRQRWRSATTLIIDECSMLDAEFFDKLEAVARAVRDDDRPFGGLQLVLCGDFLQLPPVGAAKGFCFQAKCWSRCFARADCVELTQIFRQTDSSFVTMLNELRRGCCSDDTAARLRTASDNAWPDDGILPTRLHTHKHSLDRVNREGLDRLEGEAVCFRSIDSGSSNGTNLLESLRTGCSARSELILKVGAQVILLKTINQRLGLVNGARGVVEAFDGNGGSNVVPRVRFTNGAVQKMVRADFQVRSGPDFAVRKQIPLELGYALSIHRCQGMTLDRVEMDLRSVSAAAAAAAESEDEQHRHDLPQRSRHSDRLPSLICVHVCVCVLCAGL